jgi:hypothetical protein
MGITTPPNSNERVFASTSVRDPFTSGYGVRSGPDAFERAVTSPSTSDVPLPETPASIEERSPSPAGFARPAVASSAIAVNAPPIARDLPPGFVRLKEIFESSAESICAASGSEGARNTRRKRARSRMSLWGSFIAEFRRGIPEAGSSGRGASARRS